MKASNKHIWLLPFIGGFVIIISFAFPATFIIESSPIYSIESFRWILEIYYTHIIDNGIHFYSIGLDLFGGFFRISLVLSSIIIILNFIILISANKYRKNMLVPRLNWLIVAILTILLTTIWILMKELATTQSYGFSFWDPLSPRFGIIGPFIGASFEIIGYIFIKKQVRNE